MGSFRKISLLAFWLLLPVLALAQSFSQPQFIGRLKYPSGSTPLVLPTTDAVIAYRWVSADVSDGLVTNAWNDRIQNLAAQATEERRAPVKKGNGVYFHGTSYLMINSPPNPTVQGIFAIMQWVGPRKKGGSDMPELIIGNTNTPSISLYGFGTAGNTACELRDSGNTAVSLDLPTDTLMTLAYNGDSTGRWFTNGVYSGASQIQQKGLRYIGGTSGSFAWNFWGKIYELLVYTNILSTNDMTLLHNYAVANYSTTARLDVNPVSGIYPDLWWNPNDFPVFNGSGNVDNNDYINPHSHLNYAGNFNWAVMKSQAMLYRTSGGPNNKGYIDFTNAAGASSTGNGFTIVDPGNWSAENCSWSQPYCIFACYRIDTPGTKVLWDASYSAQFQVWAGAGEAGISSGTLLKIPGINFSTDHNWQVIGARYNGNSSVIQTNAIACVTGAAGASALSQMCIGCDYNSDWRIDGAVAELLVYKGALTDAQFLAVSQYLTNRYNIYYGH